MKVACLLMAVVALHAKAAELVKSRLIFDDILNDTGRDAFRNQEIHSAVTLPARDDPSTSYHHEATVEMWIGTEFVNIGNTIGRELHELLWHGLDTVCTGEGGRTTCLPNMYIPLKVKYPDNDGCYGGTCPDKTTVRVASAQWPTEQIRQLLIGSITRAYEVMGDRMICYGGQTVSRIGMMCSVADRVKVYTPGGHMHVYLEPTRADIQGRFDCCELRLREYIDLKLGDLKSEMKSVWPGELNKFSEVRCQKSCG